MKASSVMSIPNPLRVLLPILVLVAGLAGAALADDDGDDFDVDWEEVFSDDTTRINPGMSERIDAHGVCRIVTNLGDIPMMVPHAHDVEWSTGERSFLGVTLEDVLERQCIMLCQGAYTTDIERFGYSGHHDVLSGMARHPSGMMVVHGYRRSTTGSNNNIILRSTDNFRTRVGGNAGGITGNNGQFRFRSVTNTIVYSETHGRFFSASGRRLRSSVDAVSWSTVTDFSSYIVALNEQDGELFVATSGREAKSGRENPASGTLHISTNGTTFTSIAMPAFALTYIPQRVNGRIYTFNARNLLRLDEGSWSWETVYTHPSMNIMNIFHDGERYHIVAAPRTTTSSSLFGPRYNWNSEYSYVTSEDLVSFDEPVTVPRRYFPWRTILHGDTVYALIGSDLPGHRAPANGDPLGIYMIPLEEFTADVRNPNWEAVTGTGSSFYNLWVDDFGWYAVRVNRHGWRATPNSGSLTGSSSATALQTRWRSMVIGENCF